mmetsp:Transcript_38333/g.74313  ORF Transcript_38333/g.74313 Transcript_38333/m.74313 type:complete len:200 (-) Transcript_38333:1889-2488(-)
MRHLRVPLRPELAPVEEIGEAVEDGGVRAVVVGELRGHARVVARVVPEVLHQPLLEGHPQPVPGRDGAVHDGPQLPVVARQHDGGLGTGEEQGDRHLRLHRLRALVEDDVREVAPLDAFLVKAPRGDARRHDDREAPELVQGRARAPARHGVERRVGEQHALHDLVPGRVVQPQHLRLVQGRGQASHQDVRREFRRRAR